MPSRVGPSASISAPAPRQPELSPLKLALKKAAWIVWDRISPSLFRSLFWLPLARSKNFRKALFDSAPQGKLLICGEHREKFIISSHDKGVARDLFLTNRSEFEKVGAVLKLADIDPGTSLFVNIGANIGTVCIPVVSRGLFARAIAVEPEPLNFALLSANIHINGMADKIQTHNFALGGKDDEEVLFELSPDNSGDHRIKTSDVSGMYGEQSRDCIKVRSTTFDTLIGSLDPSSTLIWMDTQGFEGHILSGATTALAAGTPMVIEFWPYGMVRCGSYPLLKEALLHGGYKRFHDLKHPEVAQPLTKDSLDGLYAKIGEKGSFTDLFLA